MSIPTEAIEAAMSAADGLGRDGNNSWSDAAIMRAALTAAAPYIQAAALRDGADALEGGWAYGAELKPDGNEDRAIAAAIQMTHENAEQLRARADQLEGKTE